MTIRDARQRHTYLGNANTTAGFDEVLHVSTALCQGEFRLEEAVGSARNGVVVYVPLLAKAREYFARRVAGFD